MHAIRLVAAGTALFRAKSTIPDDMYTAAGALAVGPLRDQTSWVQTRLIDPTGLALSPGGRLVYSDSRCRRGAGASGRHLSEDPVSSAATKS